MEAFLKLPPEYLRGLVFLTDRSNLITNDHKVRLDYLTDLIEEKAITMKKYEEEKNDNFIYFKKKTHNLPKDSLIRIFLQYLSCLYPELKNESISFCKIGVLEVRSQTLKLWRERLIKFNFHSKIIQIFKNKKTDQKNAKYTINITFYVIRWIDKEKCLFSLDSINYKNKYKNVLFRDAQKPNLEDWYENLKFSLTFDKFLDFECCDKKIGEINIIKNYQESEQAENGLLLKKRYYSKSDLSKKWVHSDDEIFRNSQFIDNKNLLSSYTEIMSENYLLNEKDDRLIQTEIIKPYYESHSKDSKERAIIINNYIEEESKFSEIEEFYSPTKEKMEPEYHRISFPLSFNATGLSVFENIVKNFNREIMYAENNYELIFPETKCVRIIKNFINERKFKLFLTLPYSFPSIESFFLEPSLIKKWNLNIQEYKIISRISNEKNISCVYEEHKPYNWFFMKRFLIYQRLVEKKDNLTLICCKSIYHKDKILKKTNFSIRSHLISSILAIMNENPYQTKIAYFIEMDHKGILTKKQHENFTINYLKMFVNLKKFLECNYIMNLPKEKHVKENTNNLENRKNITKPTIIITKVDSLLKNEKNEENILKKRKSFPIFLNTEFNQEENELKNILSEINENLHIRNCLQKTSQTKKKIYIINNNFLFSTKFWNQLECGKFEYNCAEESSSSLSLRESLGNILKNISCLPIKLLEPISELEKIAYFFSFAPLIFKDLSEFQKPLDQMKLTIIFLFSFLFLAVSQKIPFVSFLGETVQLTIGDFQIYGEKISSEKNISLFLLENDFIQIRSQFSFSTEIDEKRIKLKNLGKITIIFKKTKGKFEATLPYLIVEDFFEESKKVYYENKLCVRDIQNKMFSEILFGNPDKDQGALNNINFKINKKEKYNEFYGEIVSGKIVSLSNCKIIGSLSTSIEFDGKIYWSFDRHYPYDLQSDGYPLPSSSQYRKDIIFYKLGFFKKAENERNSLETQETNDKKLREKRKIDY